MTTILHCTKLTHYQNPLVLYFQHMIDDVSAFLNSKLSEYQVLTGPIERAARELDLSHQLMRAKVESEIVDEVPVLGALADILDISILDVLLSPNRYEFVNSAMNRAGLTSEEVQQQLRALGSPPRNEELDALGLLS